MKKIIDLDKWERKEHYLHFSRFYDPSFEITTNIDCTKAYQKAKDEKFSFFLYYLHCSLRAVNMVKEFRLRIEEENIICFDKIHAGPTIARDNGTFGFSHLPYFDDFNEFKNNAIEIIDEVKKARNLEPSSNQLDVVYYSSLPWISFTSISHPRFSYEIKDSIPKISFGKLIEKGSKKLMPISVSANHALMDGFHIAKHLELFEKYLAE